MTRTRQELEAMATILEELAPVVAKYSEDCETILLGNAHRIRNESNAEGCILSDDIRVPLDSLEADAGYLIGRVQADGSCGSAIVETIKQRCRAIRAALAAPAQALSSPGAEGELDFTPDEHHSVADMANVGYSLMQAIKTHRPDYSWNDSPTEIVGDLLEEIADAKEEGNFAVAAAHISAHSQSGAVPVAYLLKGTKGRSLVWPEYVAGYTRPSITITPLYTSPHEGWQPIESAPEEESADRMAYEGAHEDLLDWKRRALRAEDLVRKFVREVQGQTFMGEPVLPSPPEIPSTLPKAPAGEEG